MSAHLHVIGACVRDRRPFLRQTATRHGARPGVVFASCHKGLRGPFTGVDTILSAVLPDAVLRWPDLVDHHRTEILAAAPELTELIGPAPRALAENPPTRAFSQGIVTFLRDYATRLHEIGAVPPPLVFDDAHRAETTTQEFVALFVRRVDPDLWPAVVGTDGDSSLEPALAVALADHAEWQYAPAVPGPRTRTADELVAEYLQLDGTCDDPAAHEAYLALDARDRAALHDRRAEELALAGGWGVRVAALVYHCERGTDPHGKGLTAVEEAAGQLALKGFRHAAADMSERGRALADPDREADAYRRFTDILIAQTIALGRLHESAELCGELRRRYAHAVTHMTASHHLAMIHTRFATPRDHDRALEYQNTAVVIANNLPGERDRLIHGGSQDHGLALIEMHRGNLSRALELVEGAIARTGGRFGADEWSSSRARLLAALGRTDEADAVFTALHRQDPHNTDHLYERAGLARRRGDLESAVRDYTLAAELGPPFVELYHHRGSVLAELGRTDEALADFDYVLDMEPDEGETLLSRAELLLALGRLDEAADDADRALSHFCADVRPFCLRGRIHLAAGDPAQAVVCLDAALELDRDDPAALVHRALAMYELSYSGG